MKKKKMEVALVEKRNLLNELRINNFTLQELRFFTIYLAKINARDVSTRVVRFTLNEFRRIMELGRLNTSYLKTVTNSLLRKVLNAPLQSGGYQGFQLFTRCRVDTDANGDWYIEINAHDDALPLMFDIKDRYFTYELWNALRLRSTNQLRMYEILKQYEKLGERVMYLNDLKELLGMDASDYPRYNNFKSRVLDVCQRALEEHTDLKFTMEPVGKRGKGGKVQAIKFKITKNERYTPQLSLSEFVRNQDGEGETPEMDTPIQPFDMTLQFGDIEPAKNEVIYNEEINEDEEDEMHGFIDERLAFMADACEWEFNEPEIQVLYNMVVQIVPYRKHDMALDMYHYLKRRYDDLNLQASRREIKSRFGYLKKVIEADMPLGK